MNRYIVQYHSRTRVALAKRADQQKHSLPSWNFDFPYLQNSELTLFLSDWIKKNDKVNLHTGLNIIADVKTDSEEEARGVSTNFAETLLNIISFSTMAYCAPSKLISIISVLDKEPPPFRYYVYPFEERELLSSIVHVDKSTFGKIFEAYDKSSYKPRTLRALTWIRKGIGEEITVDEFLSYWLGLEVIKHILSPEKSNSDEEWEKVEEIFTKELHFENFKKIKQDGRNGLVHGFRQLDNEFIEEIGSYIEPVRKTLIYCIGSVLGLDSNVLSTIANKTPKRIEQSPWSVIKGKLKDLPREFSELASSYPRLDARVINKHFSIERGGELTVKFEVTHDFHGPSGTKWEVGEVEHWGKKSAGIQKITSGEFDVHKAKE